MRLGRARVAQRLAGRIGVVLVAASGSFLLLGAAEAQAVITEPIPADVGPGPPPIPTLPPAGETAPPPAAIDDPITPEATCDAWYRQSNYAARWPAASTWWEYQCTRSDSHYYTTCTGGACPAFCPECYWESWEWTDYFYWDGSAAVFYGESYSYSLISEGDLWPPSTSSYWWDAPTSQWYLLPPDDAPANVPPTASFTAACSGLTCSFDGSASSDGDGSIVYYSWDFGDNASEGPLATAEHTYAAPGTYTVTLTVADGQGGWDTTSQLVAVEASPPPPNAAPTASFTASCSGLSCDFDGSGSADSDGTIDAYSWKFGDGTTASGKTAQHAYDQGGTYQVELTVTDDAGATDTASRSVTVIGLTARGYKVKGLEKVDLAWSGPAGASYDLYRDGARIAKDIAGTAYTDDLGKKRPGTYTYKVCEAGTSTCSNEAKVTF